MSNSIFVNRNKQLTKVSTPNITNIDTAAIRNFHFHGNFARISARNHEKLVKYMKNSDLTQKSEHKIERLKVKNQKNHPNSNIFISTYSYMYVCMCTNVVLIHYFYYLKYMKFVCVCLLFKLKIARKAMHH